MQTTIEQLRKYLLTQAEPNHTIKELEQEKIVLLEINDLLEKMTKKFEKTSEQQQKNEIHRIKEMEQEKVVLDEINEVLNDKGKSLEELFTILSHEFRTPMVPITAYTDMLLEGQFGELNESQKTRLKLIKDNLFSLHQIISNVIISKKIELGEITMHKTLIDLTKLITGIIEKINSEESQQCTRFDFSSTHEYFIACDLERIRDVLMNLFKNSLKAIPKGSGEIKVSLDETNESVTVNITDNGKGIPKDKLPMLFSKFYKKNASITREEEGVGLGLYFCKQIMDLHNGEITIESQLGKGTSVTIVLPK